MKIIQENNGRVIDREDYLEWLKNPVTLQLFDDLRLGLLETAMEPVNNSVDSYLLFGVMHHTRVTLTEAVLEWVPRGCENQDEETIKYA